MGPVSIGHRTAGVVVAVAVLLLLPAGALGARAPSHDGTPSPGVRPAAREDEGGGVSTLEYSGSTPLGSAGAWPIQAAYDNRSDELFVSMLPSTISAIAGSPPEVLRTFSMPLGTFPLGIGYDPASNVLIVGTQTGDLDVLSPDTGALLAQVALGVSGNFVAYDPLFQSVFVTGWNGTIVQVNATTYVAAPAYYGLTIQSLGTGGPSEVAVDPANGYLVDEYILVNGVCLLSGQGLAAYDPATGSVAWDDSGSECATPNTYYPAGFAIDPISGAIVTASYSSTAGVYSVGPNNGTFDLLSAFPTGFPGCQFPCEMAYLPTVPVVLLASDSGAVFGYNLTSSAWVGPIWTDGIPGLLGVAPGGGPAWAISSSSCSLSWFNGNATAVAASADIGGGPNAIAFDPANDLAFVASSNNLTIVNVSTRQLEGSVPTGSFPNGVEYDATDASVFVADTDSNRVEVVSAENDSILASIPVCPTPSQMAWDNASDLVAVACTGNGTEGSVDVISAANDSVVASIPLISSYPDGVGYVPSLNEWFVSDGMGPDLTVVAVGNETPVATVDLPGLVTAGAVSFDPATGDISVAGSSFVTYGGPLDAIVNATSRTEVAVVSIPGEPYATVAAGGATVLGTPGNSDNVTLFDGENGTVLARPSLPGNSYPEGIAWDANLSEAIVASYGLDSLEYLSSVLVYPVEFTESGLAPGTSWSVDLNGTSYSTNGSGIQVLLPNGTYSFALVPPPGYVVGTSAGAVIVNGAGAIVPLDFAALRQVEFGATGLPNGTEWGVTFNGSYEANTTFDGAGSLTFVVVAGLYAYSILGIPGFHETGVPYAGTIAVSDQDLTEPLAFGAVTYPVTFDETGLPAGTPWAVLVDGIEYSGNGTAIQLFEPNGTFAGAFPIVPGYHLAAEPLGLPSFVVNGTSVTVSTQWVETTYGLTFVEDGLPAGTVWSVTVAGVPQTTSTDSIAIPEPNGTVTYLVPPITGYSSNRSSGSATVNAGPTLVAIAFVANGTSSPAHVGVPTLDWALLGLGVAFAALAVALLLIRRRRSPPAS